MTAHDDKPWGRLVATGFTTLLLYALLFSHEADVMALFTRTDGFHPLLPVVTAFAFSLSHGAFTGYFWDVVGVKAKAAAQARADEADTD